MRIDRQIIRSLTSERCIGGSVLQEIAGHPVVFAGAGKIFDSLAPIAAMQLGAALAGRTDENKGEAGVERHGDERSLAVARNTFDAHMLGVNC